MAVEVAGVPVVVRVNRSDVVDALERRLAPWRAEHPGNSAAISLVVAEHEDGRRVAHAVYRNGFVVRYTFSLDEALDTVEALLHTFGPVPEGTTPMHARVLERDGSVVLVSDVFAETVDGHHRRLARAGFRTWAHNPAFVDADRAEVLLPDGPPGAGSWRRVPVAQVVAFAPEGDPSDSAAVRITHLTPLVAGRDAPTRGAEVRALVALTDAVPVARLGDVAPHAVVRALEGVSILHDGEHDGST